MNKSTNIFYVCIAGFNIKILFYPLIKNKILFQQIHQRFEFFISTEINQPADYTIVIHSINPDQRLKTISTKYQNAKQYYFMFYEKKGKYVNTFDHISFSQLYYIISNAIHELLSQKKGIIIHGSAVCIDGSGSLFLAPSGGGKSTVLKLLAKKFIPIADDKIILRKQGQHFYCYTSHFCEKNAYKKNRDGYIVKGIFFLRKAESCTIKRISSRNTILKRLISQMVINEFIPENNIPLLVKLIENTTDFYTVYFSRNRDELIKTLRSVLSPFIKE